VDTEVADKIIKKRALQTFLLMDEMFDEDKEEYEKVPVLAAEAEIKSFGKTIKKFVVRFWPLERDKFRALLGSDILDELKIVFKINYKKRSLEYSY
jgi:hypothetical protein